jgi:glycerol-3-phosphate acyltransferase PlsY
MLPQIVGAVAIGFIGYLIGGIPFGAIVARRYGVDLTAAGSGATGATNVLRNLGWKPALIVAVLDVSKGAVPAVGARLLAGALGWDINVSDLLVVVAGVSAMLGHIYSPYIRLRGGKGIATGTGAVIVLAPLVILPLLVVFVFMVWVTRIVSIASLTVAALLPLAAWVLYPGRPVVLVFALLAVPLVFWAHRSNIRRLMRGEEPRTTMGKARSRDTDEERGGQ